MKPKQVRHKATKTAQSKQAQVELALEKRRLRTLARSLGISEAEALTIVMAYGLASLETVRVITVIIVDDVLSAIDELPGHRGENIRQALERSVGMEVRQGSRAAARLVEDMLIEASDRESMRRAR